VVFCAVEQRDKDNWTCAQAADLLANNIQDSSVCLIDANLERPSLHNYFDVENCGGLAGAILETGPVVGFTQPVDRGHLRLMSAGVISAGANADSVLGSGRLHARMAELRKKFDYILIDAPPATSGSTTALLATLVDGFILLVEPSFTPRQAAREAKDNIEAAGGRVLGVVLHRRELPFEPQTEKRRHSSKEARNS
jgi:succinoglycan biosynthesis transport protein ExoP